MNYRTLANMAETIRKNLHLIPQLPVVGIPRSGMIAASMIATMKQAPLATIDNARPWDEFLLVDDSISGGQTFDKVLRSFRQIDAYTIPKITTLAVYRKPTSPGVDIWFEEVPGPRVFEWNFTKHIYGKQAVWDIDGVICDEARRITDWNDLDHLRAIRTSARPLHLPQREVLAIATGRKEKEREFTEAWLKRHGVRYKQIFFSTDVRGAKRTKLAAATITRAKWIVESDFQQALWLHEESKLPVLCTDMNMMINGPVKFL